MRTLTPLLLAATLSVTAPVPAGSPQAERAVAWPALALGPEVGRVSDPVLLTHAGDRSGRWFVGERAGRVLVFVGEAPEPLVFLDIRDRVWGDRGGLRGLAFPYDFVDKRYFCLCYRARSGDLVVARFRLRGDGTGDPASEQVLLRVALTTAERPGGGIAFGADGKLYVGAGEGFAAGASRGAAQDLRSLAGKILRIEADPAAAARPVPADNPWAGGAEGRPEIWAIGVGNPQWLGFETRSGDLYQVDSRGEREEEINVQPGASAGGENYGWNLIEGTRCRPKRTCAADRLAAPAVARKSKAACELIGGAIVESLGIALFGERCSGRILGVRRDDAGSWAQQSLLETGLRVAALGIGGDGELYVADEQSGAIHRLVAAAPESKP